MLFLVKTVVLIIYSIYARCFYFILPAMFVYLYLRYSETMHIACRFIWACISLESFVSYFSKESQKESPESHIWTSVYKMCATRDVLCVLYSHFHRTSLGGTAGWHINGCRNGALAWKQYPVLDSWKTRLMACFLSQENFINFLLLTYWTHMAFPWNGFS